MICHYFKRFAAAAVAIVILSVMMFSPSAAVYGDANLDGEVNINDATYMQKILAKIIEEPRGFETYGETYLDGKISIRDVTVLQMYCVNMIDSLPYSSKQEETTEPPTEATKGTDADGWQDGIFRP